MKSAFFLCLFTIGFSGIKSLFFTPPDRWNGLAVTWAEDVFAPYAFNPMPRTREDAIRAGFTQISSCDNPKFLGERYILDNDYSVILIFDVNGFIAGIQTAFLKSRAGSMVTQSNYQVFMEEEDRYVLTAYFVDPAIICNGGRPYLRDTGTDLYIQNGPNPIRDSVKMPKRQSEAERLRWRRGMCQISMGVHYWFNVTTDMDCKDFAPVFLLYNQHKLNAFGWVLDADLTSPRYEHPENANSMNLRPVPRCLNVEDMSTMHIYLTDAPIRNFCNYNN